MHTKFSFDHKLSMHLLYGTLSPKRTKTKLRWYKEEQPDLSVILNYSREASVTAMLDELGWRSLKQRRTDQRLIMLYKIVNNLIEVDIVNELKPHSRHFRNNYSNSFRVPLARKTYLKYSF